MKKLLLFATILLSVSLFAQDRDSIITDNDTNIIELSVDNLDSMMSFWYEKQNLNNSAVKNSIGLDHHIDTPDSVIIKRLHYIPTDIPLTYNSLVKRWIHFYLQREQAIPMFLGLGQVYFPMFEEILDKYDLPLELKYLPIIESAFNPRARSRAGAVGLWQFMYYTGKMYGLEINSLVDERMDPYKSADAAARFLKDLYDKYGDWYLVLAAYNAGPGNVNKAIRRSGGKTDFWQIYPYLPRETRGYVPAFISMVYIMNYAQEHNYYPVEINIPKLSDTIMVNDTLHLRQVSEVLNIPLDQLRDLNPQYKRDIIPGHIKPYPLRLPASKTLAFIDNEKTIYTYKDSIFFAPNVYVNPARYTARGYSHSYKPCTSYSTKGRTKLYYTVKPGDTFGQIADWYDVGVRQLKCWNNRYSNKIRVGEKLVVYVPSSKVSYYKKINGMSNAQKAQIANYSHSSTQSTQKLDPNYVYYKVRKGESLYTIAQKFPGISHIDLMKINGFSSYQAKNLKPGQYIKIKHK